MRCALHRDAERDLGNAAQFYRSEAGRAVAERFLNEFEPLVYVHKVWHRLRDKAGIADILLHDLRHTCASYMDWRKS